MFWFQLDIITIFRQLRYKRRIGRNITDFTYKRPRTISFHIATDTECLRDTGFVCRARRFINLIPKAQSDKPHFLKNPAGFPTRPPNEQLWIISDPLYLTPSLGNAAKRYRNSPQSAAVSSVLQLCRYKAFVRNCFSLTIWISPSCPMYCNHFRGKCNEPHFLLWKENKKFWNVINYNIKIYESKNKFCCLFLFFCMRTKGFRLKTKN